MQGSLWAMEGQEQPSGLAVAPEGRPQAGNRHGSLGVATSRWLISRTGVLAPGCSLESLEELQKLPVARLPPSRPYSEPLG